MSIPKTKILAFLLVILGIVYGSFYPFEFEPAASEGTMIFDRILEDWRERITARLSRSDALANVILYLPFGLFGMIAFGPVLGRTRAAVAVAILGIVLSLSIEIAQHFTVARTSDPRDILTNAAGTLTGIAAGWLIRPYIPLPLVRMGIAMPSAAVLVVCWFGYRLAPFVPSLDLQQVKDSLKPLLIHPDFRMLEVIRYFGLWLAIRRISEAVTPLLSGWTMFAALAMATLGGKILIIHNVVRASELAGLIAAAGAWLLLSRVRRDGPRTLAVAIAFAVAVLVDGLEPFAFAADPQPFNPLPFHSMVIGDWDAGLRSFFRKAFLYGTLFWLLAQWSDSPRASTVTVTVLAGLIMIAHLFLPGRSADLTDPVLALLVGSMLWLADRWYRPRPATVIHDPRRAPTRPLRTGPNGGVKPGP